MSHWIDYGQRQRGLTGWIQDEDLGVCSESGCSIFCFANINHPILLYVLHFVDRFLAFAILPSCTEALNCEVSKQDVSPLPYERRWALLLGYEKLWNIFPQSTYPAKENPFKYHRETNEPMGSCKFPTGLS